MKARIIIVEDSTEKASNIVEVLNVVNYDIECITIGNLSEAMDALERNRYELLILDISMDIVPNSPSLMRDNHDMLGGLRFAKELYLNELEIPTIVVTAHDSFLEKNGPKSKISSFMSVSQLAGEFEALPGDKFFGYVTYQKDGWTQRLHCLANKALNK